MCYRCSCVFWCAITSITHCNTLQHTATHCNTLQHTATHCNTLQHTTHCNTPQHTATHCNTLQHTATHCNTLVRGVLCCLEIWFCTSQYTTNIYNTYEHLWHIHKTANSSAAHNNVVLCSRTSTQMYTLCIHVYIWIYKYVYV